ncbi:hypothetical protein T11_2632 [Trichinella zimbabwensis]|uniref:Uncharacterized protein n=1 Tax=Trichinella zimbabwensis TaxID=268475 RepID=A0A0V1HC19_9BILA|nr:hypothetical protein T11_2632 [Trichinella zimbabwensis]
MTCRVDSSHGLSSPSFVWSKPTSLCRPPPHPRDHRCAESVSLMLMTNKLHTCIERTQLELKFPDNTDLHWRHLSGSLGGISRFKKDESFDDNKVVQGKLVLPYPVAVVPMRCTIAGVIYSNWIKLKAKGKLPLRSVEGKKLALYWCCFFFSPVGGEIVV